MIEIRNKRPKNREHFSRLLQFCKKVVAICDDLDIVPVLSGSLAVFGYTQDPEMRVNDIDLACSEWEFPRLSRALEAKGFVHELKDWHVLQVRQDDLKVEFDSIEYWMAGLPEEYDTLTIDGCMFKVVGLSSLIELYRRGLEATADERDEDSQAKHLAIAEKYKALCSVIGAVNKQHWARMVKEGCGFTRPWLDLNPDLLHQYVEGRLDPVPAPLLEMYPVNLLADVEGKEVLCLASGGGQQSAVFGLLGACVTVVDLVEGQLEGDAAAAAHYGYEVRTVCADMRALSCIGEGVFDLVYQASSMAYVPDVRPVYAEVCRVLKPKGMYRVCFTNPATEFVDWNSWDGEGYRITKPYSERVEQDGEDGVMGSIQFRHYMADIFNGLMEEGFSIQQVEDSPKYFVQENAEAEPGGWDHWLTYVGEFVVVARANNRAG